MVNNDEVVGDADREPTGYVYREDVSEPGLLVEAQLIQSHLSSLPKNGDISNDGHVMDTVELHDNHISLHQSGILYIARRGGGSARPRHLDFELR